MLLAEGLGPGDEVIVPSMTFISTATSVRHVGATPVFADIDPRSFNLDPAEVARVVTSRTKAVMTVHYAGQPGELDKLAKTCADFGLLLLEDAAEAAGAVFRGVPVGTFGKSAMFSFTPTKNITMGEGGIVLTDDADTGHALRLLRNHGQWSPYEHVLLGYNWRLTEMQAAIGRVQLRKLDGILLRKRANAQLDESKTGENRWDHSPIPAVACQLDAHALHMSSGRGSGCCARLFAAKLASKRVSTFPLLIFSLFLPGGSAYLLRRLLLERCFRYLCIPGSAGRARRNRRDDRGMPSDILVEVNSGLIAKQASR